MNQQNDQLQQSLSRVLTQLDYEGTAQHECKHPQIIGFLGLFYAFLLTVIIGGVSFYLGLQLHKDFAIAVVRCIVQLLLLGLILVPLFEAGSLAAWLVFLYIVFMTTIASLEAYARPSYKYKGMLKHIIISFGLPSWTVLFYGIFVVIQPFDVPGQAWYAPQYIIPILGMILGNALDGVSLGLSNTLKELTDGSDRIEFMLAMGATRWEAVRPVLIDVLKLAFTPLINRLSVVGLVSIPGMMTGQMLGGSDPFLAAKYQIVIMFLIATAYSMATLSISLFAMYFTVDQNHMLRLDLLQKRNESGSISKWMVKQVGTIVIKTSEFSKRVYSSFASKPQPQNGRSSGGGLPGGPRSWLFPRNKGGDRGNGEGDNIILQDDVDRPGFNRGLHEIMVYSDEESYAGSLIQSETETDAAPLLNQVSGEMQSISPASYVKRQWTGEAESSSTSLQQQQQQQQQQF